MRHSSSTGTCAKWITSVLLTVSFVTAIAQANDPRSLRFHHVAREDGLSQSFVYAIVQDRQGFMWFGTQEGLNRYDGFEFTVFAHDPDDPQSISDETIRTIIEDRSGILWIGTDAGGLSRYDPARRVFVNYLHDPEDNSSIADNRVRVIYEDTAGLLWIGTDGSGLDRFDPKTETFEHFRPDPASPQRSVGANVWDILEDSEGTLWVAATSGLSRFDATTRSFVNYVHDQSDSTSISDNFVRVLYEDTDNHFWIGTDTGGLNRLDRSAGTFERFVNDPADAYSISANCINTIFEDSAGVLWIGTVEGLNVWDPATQSFDRYFHRPDDRYSLAHDTVLSIFEDRGELMWVGTYDGLSVWNETMRAMLHYKHDGNDPASLSADTVTSFAEDSTGTIWIGTFGGGLNALQPDSGRFRHWRHKPDDDGSLASDRVMAVLVDRNDVVWAGTRDAGLSRFDRQTGRFTHYRHDANDPDSLGADGVTYLLQDAQGGLWVGTFGGGLNYFEPGTQRFTRFRNDPDDPGSLSSDRVLVLYEDSRQMLWIGTYGGGMNRFDPSTQTITRFRAEPGKADGLSGDEIYMIEEDAHGDLWIGVKGGGLNRWRSADRALNKVSFERFTELDGLPSATLYSGVRDEAGFLWLSSSRGLSRFDSGALEFRNFDTSHGLQGDEFNLAAGFRAASGQLFFGGMNGFNAFHPERLLAGAGPPQVAITRFQGLDKEFDASLNRSNGEPASLDFRQHVIDFEFAALDFAAPRNNRYRYRLDGLDDDWIDAGNRRHVRYANLPAGDYTFRVRAMNNDGVWSEQDATVDFRMAPAPWRTWWAYLGYALAAATLVLLALRAQSRRAQQAAAIRHAKELGVIKARLTEAQRIAGVGNWEWNIAGDKFWLSDETRRLFQIGDQKLRVNYEIFLSLVHADDRGAVRQAFSRALNNRQPYSMEHRLRLTDGTVRVVHEQAEVAFDAQGGALTMSGTVQDITERKEAERKIRHRADFEALLAQLSTDFIRALPDDIEQQLRNSLQLVGMSYGLDAINVRWQDGRDDGLPTHHRWTRLADDKQHGRLTRVAYPWIAEQMQAGEAIAVDDVEKMPAIATADRVSFQQRGIVSFVIVPMLIDHDIVGSIAFSMSTEKRHWSDETISELRLIAETLASALTRSKAVMTIRKLSSQLQEENVQLRQEVSLAHSFEEIIGADAALRKCLQAVEKVAPTDVAVLIRGETGTGKELIARAIHKLSARKDRPMVSVNCPALPATLFESELFGHEKGAFTGAESRRLGRFELADGGTLFLDEIGELPLEVQSKLLRVLQSGEFDRLGSTETRRANVRLIAATNRDLQQAVKDGEFRADLYYRVSSFPISLPALRDRRGDIPMLAEYFVRKHAKRLGKTINAISAQMIKDLGNYEWPGNIRELESIVERALISADDSGVLKLPAPLRLIGAFSQSRDSFTADEAADLFSIERAHIIEVLQTTSWRISGPGGAATVLGIPSSTLRSKMKRLGIARRSV